MDLGPHAHFIWLAYALDAATIAGLVLWLVADGCKQRQALADLEARGVRRRSSSQDVGTNA